MLSFQTCPNNIDRPFKASTKGAIAWLLNQINSFIISIYITYGGIVLAAGMYGGGVGLHPGMYGGGGGYGGPVRQRSSKTGPDPEALAQILARTGYPHETSPSLRRYGGPPPDWTGPKPTQGVEVSEESTFSSLSLSLSLSLFVKRERI